MSEKYSVHDYTVEQILNFIKSNENVSLAICKGKYACDLEWGIYKF